MINKIFRGILNKLKEHPKRVKFTLAFFILLAILTSIFLFFQIKFGFNFVRMEILEGQQQIFIFGLSLDNCCTIFTIIGAIFAVTWAIHEYDKNAKLRQQEKASNIAKSFSDRLTIECSIICCVISNSEIFHLLELNTKNYDNFKVFNTNEIRNIYNDDNFIEKYKKIKKQSDLDQIYYRLLETRISFENFNELTANNKQYSVEEAQKLFKLDNCDFPFRFSALVTKVLNELEYLCMSLSSQVAGSKYVYQSLHQVFLRTIRLLCVEIAMSNNNYYSDKYYTSIIHVYNEWTKLYMVDLNNEDKQKEKVNEILNPKIKTV